MLPYQVVAVAIRLFAICLGISTLRTLPVLLIADQGRPPGFVYSLFLTAVMAVVSVWLCCSVRAGSENCSGGREAPV